MLEKCVFVQLKQHLDKNNLHFKVQSAYKTNYNCKTALLKIYDDLLQILKPNSYLIILFLDFSSAFDTIYHQILLERVKSQFFY